MRLIKVQFKRFGEFTGREYTYQTELENLKSGDLLLVDTQNGTNVVMVSDVNVPEREAAELRDRLRTITKALPKVGDEIEIIEMSDEFGYAGRIGTVTHIDDEGQIHGTWGGLAVIPEIDRFEVINHAG